MDSVNTIDLNTIDLNIFKSSINTVLFQKFGSKYVKIVDNILTYDECFNGINKITEVYVCYFCCGCNSFIYKNYNHCKVTSYKMYVLSPDKPNYNTIIEYLHALNSINNINNDNTDNNVKKTFNIKITEIDYLCNAVKTEDYIKKKQEKKLLKEEKEQLEESYRQHNMRNIIKTFKENLVDKFNKDLSSPEFKSLRAGIMVLLHGKIDYSDTTNYKINKLLSLTIEAIVNMIESTD